MAREPKQEARRFNWRLAGLLVVLGGLGVSTAVAGLKVHRYVLTDPQFVLSHDRKDALLIEGINYSSRAKVQRIFSTDFGRSIFSIPLEERRRRLLAIDWVESASVSRIWPDRLIVRIRERKPVAFVFFGADYLLIDSFGVLLERPAKAQFAFPVLRGVREDESEAQRRERVQVLLRVEREMGYMARDVSEVNAADADNIHIVAQVDHQAVELMMGGGNFAPRYQNFLNHFPEIHKRSPGVKVFDLRLDDRITVKE